MYVCSPAVVTFICGEPGAGKSTYSARIVEAVKKKNNSFLIRFLRKFLKLNIPDIRIFCNYPVLGSAQIDMSEVYKYNLSPKNGKSVLIIDEAGFEYNSREFKSFSRNLSHWYQTTRHRKTQIFVLVQSWDRVDKNLRELCSRVYCCYKFFGFTVMTKWKSKLGLTCDEKGRATEFKEVFDKSGFGLFYRPKYYHMFNSYYLDREYEEYPYILYPAEVFPDKRVKTRFKDLIKSVFSKLHCLFGSRFRRPRLPVSLDEDDLLYSPDDDRLDSFDFTL